MTELLSCEICGYIAKGDVTVVRMCADGIIRCKVCRDKAKYGRYIRDDYKSSDNYPPVKHDWESWLDDITLDGD